MNKLSQADEQRLLGAVQDVCTAVDDRGLTPDEAVIKVAQEYRLPAGFIPLVVNAFNIGRVNAQREDGAAVLDKYASVPLADAAACLRGIYPEKVPSPQAQKMATDVSGVYSRPPVPAKPRREKAASVVAPPPPRPQDPEIRSDHDFRRLADEKRAVEEARYQEGAARDRLFLALAEAGDYFKKFAHDRLDFAAVRRVVRAKHGSAGDTVMEYIRLRNKLPEATTKAAGLLAYDSRREPFNLIEDCLQAARELCDKRAAYLQRDKQAGLFVEQVIAPYWQGPAKPAPESLLEFLGEEKQAGLLSGIGKAFQPAWQPQNVRIRLTTEHTNSQPHRTAGAVASSLAEKYPDAFKHIFGGLVSADTVDEKEHVLDAHDALQALRRLHRNPRWGESGEEKQAAGLGVALSSALGSAMAGGLRQTATPPATGELVDSMVGSLNDPAHDNRLRAIKAKADLTDMLANDEHLSGYDPDDVLRAYNEVSELAPRAATQPLLMRALLHKHLSQGRLEPFEAGEIAKTEGTLRGNREPSDVKVSSLLHTAALWD